MVNVLLVTKGTGGYLSPFLELGRALKARGHGVTLLTHCQYAEAAGQAGLGFAALDTPDEFEKFIADGHLLNAAQDIPEFFRRHVMPQVQSEYANIEACCISERTVLVAPYLSDIAARLAAEKLRVPFVRVFVAPIQAAGVSLLGDLCTRVLGPDINQSREEIGLPPVQDWRAWLQHPRRSIGLWPDWFGCPEPGWPQGVTLTGFLGYDDVNLGDVPPAIQEILGHDEQPVLITGGTGMFGGDEFFSTSVEACRRLGCTGILITRQQSLVPGRLPSNVVWLERVPSLASLMSHVGAVIHHGGMGTLFQALRAGTPQLLLASGGDRTDNAGRLQSLGVAEFLRPPRWQADSVAEALYRLTHSAQVRERCSEVADWLRNANPAAAACDVIERVLSERDSVHDDVTVAPAASNSTTGETEEGSSGETGGLPEGLAGLSAERRAFVALRLRKSQRKDRG